MIKNENDAVYILDSQRTETVFNMDGVQFTAREYKALKIFFFNVRNIFTNIQPLMTESQMLDEISSACISCHLALGFPEEMEQKDE